MPSDSLVALLRRRWYVVLVFALLTADAMLLTTQSDSIYWARAEVNFVAPKVGGSLTRDLGPSESLVPFAAAVEREVVGATPAATFTLSSAPLHASGLRSGASVRLADEGGQWQRSFKDPILIVEVVDPDQATAQAALVAQVAGIERSSQDMQEARGIPLDERISTDLARPERSEITATRSGTYKAWLLILILGAVLSLDACRFADRGFGVGPPRLRT